MSFRPCLLLTVALGYCIMPLGLEAQSWTPSSAPRQSWTSLASSADGKTLGATTHDGDVFISQDSGRRWAKVDWLASLATLGLAPAEEWTSAAVSADGESLAVAAQTGAIFTSADGGKTWVTTGAPTNIAWLSVTMSADGKRLAAAGNHFGIYLSPDGGQTWTAGTNSVEPWAVVESSADGSKLVAAADPGAIYYSGDFGTTWTTSSAPILSWSCLASSSDATRLVAGATLGGIYLSTDSGATWTKSSAPDDSWFALASSADGNTLAAAALYGGIYLSSDSGATWVRSTGSTNSWSALTASAKGKFVAAAFNDYIYLPEAGSAKGNYLGLFYQTNGATLDSSGLFTATVSSNRAFTGKFTMAGKTFRFSGLLPTNGPVLSTITRPLNKPLQMSLQADGESDSLRGFISDGNWNASLFAGRVAYSKSKPPPQSGRKYTMAMAAQGQELFLGEPANVPGTVGYGTLAVDGSGNVNFKGKLADGSAVSQKLALNSLQQWPLFAPLYGNKGLLMGWLNFIDGQAFDLNGSVTWIKPAQSNKLFPAAFTRTSGVLGSRFNYTNSVPALGLNNSMAAFVNRSTMAQSFTNTFVFANKVADKTNELSLTISPTGGFKGSAVAPNSNKRIAFDGVVLQRTNLGFGYLRLPGQEAGVLLGPAPPTVSTNN